MRFPLQSTVATASYIAKSKLRRKKISPIVLMLEPLHACNLACEGCGRIREYKATIREQMPLEDLLEAVDVSQTPVVSICGGEPLIYKQIGELTAEILKRGRSIHLCTNAVFLKQKLHLFKPGPMLTFMVHLDGGEEFHDKVVVQKGVFKKAIEAMRAAKEAGFRVCTNTTVYKDTDMKDLEELFTYLEREKLVDGLLVSPAYSYTAVDTKEIFMDRAEIRRKFNDIVEMSQRFRFINTPLYLKYLQGSVELECTPWGTITRNPNGWKGPCYLMTEQHYQTYDEFINGFQWENYGPGKHEMCKDCLVHCGFEPTVALQGAPTFSDTMEMIRWNFS